MFVHKLILGVCAILLLNGCGLHPLYKESNEEVQYHLSRIKIHTIPDREGQLLHNQLSTLLSPYGAPRHPLYMLSTSITFSSRGIAIRKDASTSQEAIDLKFTFILSDFKTGDKLYSSTGTLSADNSVSFTSPYSNLIEEKSSKKRLIEEAAQSIRLHLASFFSKK